MEDLYNSFMGIIIKNTVLFILGWTAFDYVWKSWVNHVAFEFNTTEHIVTPLIAAVIFTFLDSGLKKKNGQT